MRYVPADRGGAVITPNAIQAVFTFGEPEAMAV